MAEATSRSYASACCIGRKPNVVSAVLGNSGKLRKRDQHKGKREFSSGLSALPFRERYQVAVHQRTLMSAQIASLLG